mgnify:FL=1
MLRYRLLAIDIDGTLVNSRDELTPATRVALSRVAEAGIRIVLATGRRYSRTLPLVEPLGIDVPLVTASGALVKDPLDHRTLYRAEFDQGLLRRTLTIVAEHGFDSIIYADTFSEGFDFYYPRMDVSTRQLAEYLEMNPDCGRHWPQLVSDPPPEIFAGFTMGTQGQMLNLEHALHQGLPRQLHTHVLRSPRYTGFMCEFSADGVTKWSAIHRLAEQWGIGEESICAVGDDVNDIPMIRAAGLGVAMGNAQPQVKAAADWIVSSHDEDGLVQVAQRLLK